MLKRGYYCCGKCGWQIEKGRVDWGLVDLVKRPFACHEDGVCRECKKPYTKATHSEFYCCPECNTKLECVTRDIVNDNKPEIMGTPYKVPIHSDALALTPDSIAEHKEKFPDIEIDNENRPVFTNAKQHDDYMNKCGIRKQTQKTGQSKGKIYSYPGSKCS